MTDLADLSITQAAKLLRARKVSAVELTQACLARIARLDPDYNAFISVLEEDARAQAGTADADLARGVDRGPLHGIPYAAKDIFDVAGQATTCHSKLRMSHRAETDATVIVRLREAGAVLLGRTALHEFATGGPAFDLPWPPARNPWKRDAHPGGSSSGSGVAVALGMAPLALGTDTGGSVRNPATCCGVVGMKPTYGAISRAGVFPLSFSLDHVGPLTRTVEDNAIVFDALAGHDSADVASARRTSPRTTEQLRGGVAGLRVGVIDRWFRDEPDVDPELVSAFDAAADTLRKLGADVRPLQLSPLPVWAQCGRTILQSEAYAIHERDLQERPADFAAITRSKLLPGAFIPAHEYVKAQQWRRALANEFATAMQDFDVAITLSSFTLPCRIDDPEAVARTYERQARMPFNVTGTPALAVPTGFSRSGLPLGMQIVGHAFDEQTVYRVAWAYCEATGFTNRRPPAVSALGSAAEQSGAAQPATVK